MADNGAFVAYDYTVRNKCASYFASCRQSHTRACDFSDELTRFVRDDTTGCDRQSASCTDRSVNAGRSYFAYIYTHSVNDRAVRHYFAKDVALQINGCAAEGDCAH